MDLLKITKNNSSKGLCIYCTTCKRKVNNKCGATGKRISTCPNKDKHKFKVIVHIPGGDDSKKTKLLSARNENEAVKQANSYREELEKSNYSTMISSTKTSVPQTIDQGMAYYVSFLCNETPHEQEHKQRSKGHTDEVVRYFKYFKEYLVSVDIVPSSLLIVKLDKNVVGKLKSYLLKEKNYAPKTYNKYIGLMRVFVAFLIEEFELKMRNPFKSFKRLKAEQNIDTITNKEFTNLLKIITPENGIEEVEKNGARNNWYKPWLKDAFLLALLTGRRREEIVSMKFSGIAKNKSGKLLTIRVDDFKVNRSNDLSAKESVKSIYIPIISPLKKLLIDLGYEKYKGQDKFILAPTETMQRKTIMDFMSKAFTFYYKQLKTGRNIKFYDLRKTYISHLYAAHGDKAKIITKHSGNEVMLNHYVDEKVIAEVAKDFDFFKL